MKVAIHFEYKCSFCGNTFIAPKISYGRDRKYCNKNCFGKSRKVYFDKIYGSNERRCRTCKNLKNVSEFSPDHRVSHKRQTQCKSCKAEWMRNDRIKDREKYRYHDIKKMYGMSPTQYNGFLIEQKGVCAICKQPEIRKNGWLHIDHCHRTGLVRGLLCGNCNTGIGKFGDSVVRLKNAIQYLEGGER